MSELTRQSTRETRAVSRWELDAGIVLAVEWDHGRGRLIIDLGVRPGDIAEEPGYRTELDEFEAASLAHFLSKVVPDE